MNKYPDIKYLPLSMKKEYKANENKYEQQNFVVQFIEK